MRRNHRSQVTRHQCDIRVLVNTKLAWNSRKLRYEWVFEPTGKVLGWISGDAAADAMKKGFFDAFVNSQWLTITRTDYKYDDLMAEKKEGSS